MVLEKTFKTVFENFHNLFECDEIILEHDVLVCTGDDGTVYLHYRTIYDVLDFFGVYLTVGFDESWWYHYQINSNKFTDSGFGNRKDAEIAAFTKLQDQFNETFFTN